MLVPEFSSERTDISQHTPLVFLQLSGVLYTGLEELRLSFPPKSRAFLLLLLTDALQVLATLLLDQRLAQVRACARHNTVPPLSPGGRTEAGKRASVPLGLPTLRLRR